MTPKQARQGLVIAKRKGYAEAQSGDNYISIEPAKVGVHYLAGWRVTLVDVSGKYLIDTWLDKAEAIETLTLIRKNGRWH